MDIKEYKKQWALKNQNKLKQKRKEYYQANKEKLKARWKEYREKYPDKVRKNQIAYREKTKERWQEYHRIYGKENLGKINSISAKRRAALMKATPPWLTSEHLKQIEEFYLESKRLETLDGIERNVDHIVPLQGKTVCGLHVPWNLQILTGKENRKKRNKL